MDFATIFGNALRSALGADAAIYALAAIGLNLHFGYTGLLNFGQVGFMIVGAYGLAVSVATWGWSMWVGIGVGLGLAVVLALALGLPTLRLRADYFAITTVASAEILRILARSKALEDWTGGVYGLQRIAPSFYDLNPIPRGRYGPGTFSFPHQQLWVAIVTWALVALCTVLVALLVRSPWGRVLKAIREDEDAVRSLGKNVVGYKMQSLVVGGMIGALAGIMLAVNGSAVNADSFQPTVTFFAYAVLILGGVATRVGPVVGAALFWFLISGVESFVREAGSEDLLPNFLSGPNAPGAVSNTLVGLLLIGLLLFRPQGIFGNRREMELSV